MRITTFNQQTMPGLKTAIEEIKTEAGGDLRGYVVDLRNNPGGLLDQAVEVYNAFIEPGEIVYTRARADHEPQRLTQLGTASHMTSVRLNIYDIVVPASLIHKKTT